MPRLNPCRVLKPKVIELRAKGHTYSEIVSHLDVKIPKSTLSDWCQGVQMPEWYEKKVQELNQANQSRALQRAWVSMQLKREKLLGEMLKSNHALIESFVHDRNLQKVALIMLYLGEGAKRVGRSGLQLGSSEPLIVLLYIKLLYLVFKIPKSSLRAYICYRADQDISTLTDFWSKFLKMERAQFYPSKPDPRTIGKPTKKKEYRGVCTITCRGADKQLELETLANRLAVSLGR